MARGFSLSRGPAQSAATPASNEQLKSSRVWTPLLENHFDPPLLSSRERAYLVRKSCEASLELVGRARSAGGPIAWRHIKKENGVQLYSGSLRTTATGAPLTAAIMCGVTSVPGTVTEVASLFQLGSTRQMKEFARAHREWFYDGVVLHSLAPRTKEKPLHQVTAKWMVMQMPQGVAHRDFCFLECQDKFIDTKGRKGWVLGQHSIKLPGCDDLKREFGFIRGSMYHSGFVVVESEERAGHVDVIHLVQMNLKEHTPVSANLLRARVMFVVQVRNMLRSKRLNEQRYKSDLELVPRKYRARCAVCQDSFSLLLLRKLNCRKCGEVVCAACSKEFPIENRSLAATNGQEEVRKLRICMHCFQAITNAPKPTSALVEPPHASTMSMSFLGYHDDEQQASLMTLQVNGHQGHQGEEQVKIFLQSMRRDKPLRPRMSSTLPAPNFGGNVLPSNSGHRGHGEPDGEWYRRPQQQYQKQQLDNSFSLDYNNSQRLRSSDFRPSQSMSLDDPIARGDGRYMMQRPEHPGPAAHVSIFDRSANGDDRRSQNGMPRSRSSDMLLGTSEHRTSNLSRLQVLSSRERLEQLQRQDNYTTHRNADHRMPDAYMSALEQASRDKLDFDAPPIMYHTAPPSDFGAFSASLDDHAVIPPDFGPYDLTVDEQNGPPPLDMGALTTAASISPFDFDSMGMLPAARSGDTRERDLLRRREREIRQRRQSTSSDSSAVSIDIDSYDDLGSFPVVPPIAEHLKFQDKLSGERMMYFDVPGSASSISKEMKAAYIRETDEDSETSMGASDDEEERRPIDDDAEEWKSHGLDQTLALPSTFSSAHKPTNKIQERPSISNMLTDFYRSDDAMKLMSQDKATDGLAGIEQQLQRSKLKDLIDFEHDQINRIANLDDQVSEKSLSCDNDGSGNTFALCEFSDPSKHKQRLSEIGDEVNYSSVDCDTTNLNENTRQLNSRSPNIHQTRDGDEPAFQEEHGMYALASTAKEALSTISTTHVNGVQPSYEHVRSSPDHATASKVPISMTDTAAVENRQANGDDNFKSHLCAFNKMSLSSTPPSNARGSSIRSMSLDSFTPPTTPSSSPQPINSFSTTSVSSPAAVSCSKLADVSSSDDSKASFSSQNSSNSPAYLPGRFSTLEQFHKGQQQMPVCVSNISNHSSQNSVHETDPENLQPDALNNIDVHQEQQSQAGGTIEESYRLPTSDKRSHTTTINSKDE